MRHTLAASRATETSVAALGNAEICETHTGIVVLAGGKAYKGKKPVATDVLDFTTPERRKQACERELALNRRLAPASYLGIAYLSDPQGGPAEPVILMHRYPDSRRLATLVRRGQQVTGPLIAIAEKLANFHDHATRGSHVDSEGKIVAISARWRENIAELERFTGCGGMFAERLEEIDRLATRFIAGRSVLFADRVDEHHMVDGHADLLADDIFCMPDGPEILDCLEFDDRLRYVDTIDDVAFLAMDLEFLDRKDLGDFFLDRYSRLTGDSAPRSLKDFYIAYRAVVRAKVDCVRFGQGHNDAALDASRHLDIAIDHLRTGAVRLALIGGGPGTGKTTLVRQVAARAGAQVISTDDVRRELQDAGAIAGRTGVLNDGLYSTENVDAVYATVLRRTCTLLAWGQSVILDGTWRLPRYREEARSLAAESDSAILELLCTAPAGAAAKRVAGRTTAHVSDATPQIARALTAVGEEWPDAHRIDTTRPLPDSVREAEELWRYAI